MINVTGLFFLLLVHYLSGRGLIKLFKLELSAIATLSLSMISGVGIASFVPCIMQLMHIPITASNIYIALSITTTLFCIPLLLHFKRPSLPAITLPKLYELPFFIVFAVLSIISVWRCFYLPPNPRDVLTGVELIAEYTVREKTMINSALNIDLRLGRGINNIFKSQYITSLQIIYKLLVQPFGQLWLSILFLSFTGWLYSLLRERIHPFIACVLLMIYFAIPELFAYSYIILFDYPTMVYFVVGYYFLMKYIEHQRMNELIWVSLMFGLATFIRSETLLIVALSVPLMAYHLYKNKKDLKYIGVSVFILCVGPLLFNFIYSSIFIKQFIPFSFGLSEHINHNLTDIPTLLHKFTDITAVLVFSPTATRIFAYFYNFFLVTLVVDLVWKRRLSKEASLSLWGIAIVYTGLALLSFLVEGVLIENTIKRGIFRLIPLISLYMANSYSLQQLSEFLKRKEAGIKKQPVTAPTPSPRQQTAKKK